MSERREFVANCDEKKTIELPDCPLCGSALGVTHIGNAHTKSQKLKVKCSNSSCRIERTDAVMRGGIDDLIRYQEKAWQAARQSSEAEPDWSDSETPAGEVWKNSLFPLSERIQFADGEIAFQRKVVTNLRSKLEEQPPARVPEKEIQDRLNSATRQFRHNSDNTGTVDKPEQGFVIAYDRENIDSLITLLTHQPSAERVPEGWDVHRYSDGMSLYRRDGKYKHEFFLFGGIWKDAMIADFLSALLKQECSSDER